VFADKLEKAGGKRRGISLTKKGGRKFLGNLGGEGEKIEQTFETGDRSS